MSDLVERVAAVRLLLQTMNDPYPAPRVLLVPDSGPAASRYVPCETCRQSGEVRVRTGWMICLVCDGAGWKRRERRDQEWDAYLEMPLVDAAALPRASSARRPVDPARLEASYAWERALHVQDRHGSYAAVRRALEWLQGANPRRAGLVRSVLVNGEERRLSEAAQVQLDLGVTMIALRTGTVRVPPWLIERPARQQTVSDLVSDGLSPGQIARRLGMSKRAVQRQIRKGNHGKVGGRAGVPRGGT